MGYIIVTNVTYNYYSFGKIFSGFDDDTTAVRYQGNKILVSRAVKCARKYNFQA